MCDVDQCIRSNVQLGGIPYALKFQQDEVFTQITNLYNFCSQWTKTMPIYRPALLYNNSESTVHNNYSGMQFNCWCHSR